MGITDERFAAQAVSPTRKRWTFDSVECLAGFVQQASSEEDIAVAWVGDFARPGQWIRADEAWYVQSTEVASPMGLGLAAFATSEARDAALAEWRGEPLDWAGVRVLVAERWPDGTPHRGRHMEEVGPDGAAAEAAPTGTADPGLLTRPPFDLQAAIDAAPAGGRVSVPAGTLRPSATIRIDKPLVVEGEPGAVLDGTDAGGLLEITGDSVVVRGVEFRNVGRSFMEDRAALKVEGGSWCTIEHNRFEDTFFGVYLANSEGCRISDNHLRARETRETSAGNGIHLWYSKDVEIVGNDVSGHRDGIYFEFVEGARVSHNRSTGNLRYGLHFMFSDSCDYRSNDFTDNGAGVAVMYSRVVTMTDNRFSRNHGTAAFGLLLKDITDGSLQGNRFEQNSVGLYAEGATRLHAVSNEFLDNGWAVKLMADSEDSRFEANHFAGNAFDVATNSRRTEATFRYNSWDAYRGYDLDRDGIGDVPYHPVRLFSLVVEQNEPTLVFLRSFLVTLLDTAEALVPLLTPASLVDPAPRVGIDGRGAASQVSPSGLPELER